MLKSIVMDTTAFNRWLRQLATLPDMPNVHNLFTSSTKEGIARLTNLRRYFEIILSHNPNLLLVGEAPGYQGTYRTGIPFCSEAIMLGSKDKFNLFGGEANGFFKALSGERIWKEPSATIVQRTITELTKPPLIWATFPLHPHQSDKELSNRAPDRQEIIVGAKILSDLLEILPAVEIIAVGNIAKNCLDKMGVQSTKIRHPSRGGARQFAQQLLAIDDQIKMQ